MADRARGAAPEASGRLLRAEDVFRLRFLAQVAISPDGRRVACTERRVDERLDGVRSRILVVDVATGAVHSPSPGDATDSAPRWSADGAVLVFHADRGPSGTGPRVAPADGGSGRAWPGVADDVVAMDLAPDASAIVVVRAGDDAPPPDAPLWEVTGPGWQQDAAPTVERRTWSRLWRVDADGRAAPLTPEARGVHDRAPRWSPDGRWIAFLSDRPVAAGSPLAGTPSAHPRARLTRLWLVAADGSGEPVPLLPPVDLMALAWASGGRSLAWLGAVEPAVPGLAAGAWITSVPDGVTRSVPLAVPAPGAAVRADDPRGMADATLAWTDDGRLWLRWAEGGEGHLGSVDPVTGALTRAVTGERAALAFDVTPDGSVLAHVTATADHPGELTVCAPDGSGARVLTDTNGWLREVRTAPTVRIGATGPGDLPLEGWLTLPPEGAPVRSVGLGGRPAAPIVVSVHGGPHYPVGWRFSFETQRLAARGYAVLAGNVRGSTGYGDRFATAITGDWGGRDLDDTHALLDAAGAAGGPAVDAGRAAITGVSYGGYLTLRAISQGDRFRAAIAENPLSDLVSAFGSAEDDGGFWLAEMGGAPWDIGRVYLERSPVAAADRIRTPVLLLHAEEDHNCPIGQSEELVTALLRLGRPVRFLRARGVGHLMNFTGSGRFRLARASAIDDWLDRYLALAPLPGSLSGGPPHGGSPPPAGTPHRG